MVVGITAVVTGIVVAAVVRSRTVARSVSCTSNLRQLQAALMQYAMDHDNRFPDPYELDTTWEQLLAPRYLTDMNVLRCDSDPELYPSVGSSYDWRDTGRPETTLAGRSINDMSRAPIVMVFEGLPEWHAAGFMNVARSDGSAAAMTTGDALGDLQQPIRALQPADANGGPR